MQNHKNIQRNLEGIYNFFETVSRQTQIKLRSKEKTRKNKLVFQFKHILKQAYVNRLQVEGIPTIKKWQQPFRVLTRASSPKYIKQHIRFATQPIKKINLNHDSDYESNLKIKSKKFYEHNNFPKFKISKKELFMHKKVNESSNKTINAFQKIQKRTLPQLGSQNKSKQQSNTKVRSPIYENNINKIESILTNQEQIICLQNKQKLQTMRYHRIKSYYQQKYGNKKRKVITYNLIQK